MKVKNPTSRRIGWNNFNVVLRVHIIGDWNPSHNTYVVCVTFMYERQYIKLTLNN